MNERAVNNIELWEKEEEEQEQEEEERGFFF